MRPLGLDDSSDKTDFGYRRVSKREKTRRVRAVFETVAPRYDLMNDFMSAGLHRLWKNILVQEADPRPAMTILDLAGGTGDVIQRIAARRRQAFSPSRKDQAGALLVCDINPAMLTQGRDRFYDTGSPQAVLWVGGNGEALPLPDNSIHLVTMAFGLRNITRKSRTLEEILRVLKPGGGFFCLEFSQPDSVWGRRLYDLYSFTALPILGKWIIGDAAPYRYLAESIRMFPDRHILAEQLRQTGFQGVYYRQLSGGIVTLYGGRYGKRVKTAP